MKHLFIVNPKAGGHDRTEEIRQQAVSAFAAREDRFEVYTTTAPMDAAEKIRAEAASGEELRVYSCGGDGTFNECVCGAVGLENVAVCPFPTGTGNDFCRMFGAEKDCFRDLDALLDGWAHPIDVIDCNGRMSVNICSVGIDARVGIDVHKYSRIPIIGGAAGYVVSLLVNVFKGLTSQMRVRCGDYSAEGKHTLVCACNGRYYGGGFNPSADARPDDGVLDIYIVKGVGLLQAASLIGKYASGRGGEVPEYVTRLQGTELEVELDEEDVVNIDGEGLYTTSIRMKLLPGALKLLVPATMHFFDDKKPALQTV